MDVYGTWPREHNNVFLFKQNEKKYDLFEDPIVSSLLTVYCTDVAAVMVATLSPAMGFVFEHEVWLTFAPVL